MIEVTKYRNQKVAVFGLGKSGVTALKALKSGGARVLAWDDSEARRNAVIEDDSPVSVALELEENLSPPEEYRWKDIAALVLSPGIPLTHPEPHRVVKLAEAANCPVICDIELLYQTCRRSRYIGITGTNGKSTTTSLIGHILQQVTRRVEIGGNLGIPALELQPLASDGTYVLEMSSYQLDLLKETKFNIAVLLNITPDHLDRHGDMAGYIAAKKHLFDRQGAEDTAFIGVDNTHSETLYKQLQAEKRVGTLIPISAKEKVAGGVSVIDGVLYNGIGKAKGVEERYLLGPLQYLPGNHNAENIAASFAAAYQCAIPAETIIAAIRSFPGLRHRLQYIAEIAGVRYVNDSKATNAEAAEKALLSYDNIYWIAGGVAKEGGIAALAPHFSRITHAFLIGKAEEEFAKMLEGKVQFTRCGDLAGAFAKAAEMATVDAARGVKAPVVLLSPACASFDQWPNFEKRGDAFCTLVEEWARHVQGGASVPKAS